MQLPEKQIEIIENCERIRKEKFETFKWLLR